MILLDLLRYSYIAHRQTRLSKQQIKDLQRKKFHKLVAYINERSPYYQDIIKKNKIDIENCKPEDFPVLTKNDVIENFDKLVTDPQITKAKIDAFLETSHNSNDLFLHKYCVIHTSGSSGTVGHYIYTQKELLQGVATTVLANTLTPFQKFAFIGAAKGHYAGITMVNITKRLPFIFKNTQAFDINLPFNQIIEGLNKMQPTSVSGYAFALKKLAEAQQIGKLSIKPKTLQSSGEPLGHRDKDYIQKVFNSPIINMYAASEHLIIGLGTDIFGGMYLMENNLIFEIASNHTIVTNLFNYTLPLIRYQMSDRLQPITNKFNIMPFTKVKTVIARNEYNPIFTNDKGEEDFINFHIISAIFIKNIIQFQMWTIDKHSFTFKICLEKNLSKTKIQEAITKLSHELRSMLDEKLMTNVKFKIEIVDHLWADPKTGKFQLIVKLKR